ncbi:MAG: restriction endonuclease [Clostridiales bacterium]|nr:restriction endonuclease [Clostridiales bacterium]
MLSSGKQATYVNRIAWSVAYLKKAGLLDNPARGKYVITPKGQKFYKKHGCNITLKLLEESDDFKEFRYGGQKKKTSNMNQLQVGFDETDSTPEESMEKAHREINAVLRDDLLKVIMERKPRFFEYLVVELLQKMGYGGTFEDAGFVTGRSSDEGIDGEIREDKLGFSTIYIQAKRRDPNTTIGRPDIHQFVGALGGKNGTKGLFITTAKFTKEATAYALKKPSNTSLILVDGDMLAQLMIDNNIGVSTINTYEVKRIDNDFFTDDFE